MQLVVQHELSGRSIITIMGISTILSSTLFRAVESWIRISVMPLILYHFLNTIFALTFMHIATHLFLRALK